MAEESSIDSSHRKAGAAPIHTKFLKGAHGEGKDEGSGVR
jgi:hypothetical protein